MSLIPIPGNTQDQYEELADHLAIHTSNLTDIHSGVAVNEIIYNGFMVYINFTSVSRTWAEGEQIGIVPSGLRPRTKLIATGSTYQSNIGFQVKIATDGKVTYDSQTGFTGRLTFIATYIL